jgi:hypothetical protein
VLHIHHILILCCFVKKNCRRRTCTLVRLSFSLLRERVCVYSYIHHTMDLHMSHVLFQHTSTTIRTKLVLVPVRVLVRVLVLILVLRFKQNLYLFSRTISFKSKIPEKLDLYSQPMLDGYLYGGFVKTLLKKNKEKRGFIKQKQKKPNDTRHRSYKYKYM